VAECEGVDAVVGFVFGGAVVQEASYESALRMLDGSGKGMRGRTDPAY
jgi:hypothetical protein